MTYKFRVDEYYHASSAGTFDTFEAAYQEIQRRVELPYDHEDNVAPCVGHETCSARYHIQMYDASSQPYWVMLLDIPVVKISKNKVEWLGPRLREQTQKSSSDE
jgi:hypothetical protein